MTKITPSCSMRRALILGVAAVVLLVGCTSGNTKTSTGGPATVATSGADSAEASQAPGVTNDAIKIAVFYVDQKALQVSGISLQIGDYTDSYKALIDQINSAGGINGRKIDASYVAINPAGTASAQAACVQATQDDKVFAIVGFFLNDAVLCPLQTEDTAVIGGTQTTQLLAEAKAPWFTVYAGSDATEHAVKAFKQKGLLSGKIGVFAHTNDADLLDNQVMPELQKMGVDTTKAVLSAPDNDQAATVSGTRAIAQRFQSEGIKKVLLVGASSEDWFLGMQGQSYRPQLLITDSTAVQAFLSNKTTTNTSLLHDAIEGAAYTQGTWVYDEPHLQTCFAELRKAGVSVPRPNPDDPNAIGYTGPEEACADMTLLKAILTKAGHDLDYATFREAGYHLGTIHIPGDPSPHTFGPPPGTDGNAPIHLLPWDEAKKAFVAQGS